MLAWGSLALLIGGLDLVQPLIFRLYNVKEIMDASKVIVEAEVATIDPKSRTAIALVKKVHKGNCVFKEIKMNIGIGQAWFPEALMKQLHTGAPVLFFYDVQDRKLACLGHTNGIWFQLFGDLLDDPGKVWWQFTHIEVHMNRTFQGSTADLVALVAEIQAGRRQSPAPNQSLPALTREELLGKARPEEPAQTSASSEEVPSLQHVERPDGLEKHPEWTAETWGNPAQIVLADDADSRGQVLEVCYQPGNQDKIAVTRILAADFSRAGRLLFEACNVAEKPVSLAWAITTMPDWQYFESPPIELEPGRWRYDLAVNLLARTFKCAATDWDYASPLLNRNRIAKLTFLIYDAPEKGTLRIDRLRPETGNIFVRSLSLPHSGKEARSVSWADYDNDGDLDIFVCSTSGNRLYQNRLGEFFDDTAPSGLGGGSRCASWADYDKDGDLDIFLSTPALWTNEQGKFRDDSGLLPTLLQRNTEGAGWMDANGDGWPDLLLTNGEHGICLFLNQGKAPQWFQDATAPWGLGKQGPGNGNGDFLSLADFDSDGFADLLYNLGRGLLLRNHEGHAFQPVKNSNIDYTASNDHKLGNTFADYDNDEDIDLFVPQKDRPCLFRNNNDFTFTNVIQEAGDLSKIPRNSRTAAWGDVNSDGYLDLVVGFSDHPLELFLNEGKGTFANQTAISGFQFFQWSSSATGLAFADFDNDGDLDLLVTSEDTHSGILINQCPKALASRTPLCIRLPRSQSPGATVRLQDNAGRSLGLRQIGLVQNFSSQQPPEVFYAVMPGAYKISVLLSQGELVQEEITVRNDKIDWEMKPKGNDQ